ncbi:putative UDP-glucosyl transferase 84B2 [Hibiscus syriacus]|uniref:UDP-glucosyl transferase 84B2 n=2 Tax=Hibiscus syriacus TaxID=106335 RepID=A0A6A3A6X6_HIBSY|nr:putative UDP-glucosyl transferase 84B2 [Hibiscus syriacus]
MSRNFAGRKVPDFFDIGLYLGAIKGSGPSGPGEGHGFVDGRTLGGIKNSGPSPGGEGHKFTDSQTLGGIKNSGPSPGEGHSSTLGGIKNSGSSLGNGVTVSINLGSIKDSGPSPVWETSSLIVELMGPSRTPVQTLVWEIDSGVSHVSGWKKPCSLRVEH